MALPASGAISLGQVNTELGISPSTTTISLNQAAVRALFIKSSGAIAMSDGHGKSAMSAALFPGITNYGVNDRTEGGYNDIIISGNAANNSNNITLTYAAATGGGTIAYEWQFLPFSRFYGTSYCGGVSTPLVGSAQTWNGYSGYNDSISGASTRTLTLTGFAYYGSNVYHGVAGLWRLKSSNSAGATYSAWTGVKKKWNYYTYDCNCVCNGGYYTEPCGCYCPGGCWNPYEYNCTTGCTEVCSNCSCNCDTIYTCACSSDCTGPPDVHYPGGQCFGDCAGCPQQGTCYGCCNCQNVDCTGGCQIGYQCTCPELCSATCTYCNNQEVCDTCDTYGHIDVYGIGGGCAW